jgi:sulfur carrier protein ThiS
MRVTIKLYATLTDYLPAGSKNNRVETVLSENTTIDAALAPFALPPKLTHLVLVNGVFIPREMRATALIRDGDTLAVWPPIAGG